MCVLGVIACDVLALLYYLCISIGEQNPSFAIRNFANHYADNLSW